MSRLVGSMLSEGAAARYERVLALKYLLLLDDLRERGPEAAAAADRLEANLGPFQALNALEIVRHGTPFFWLNVHRLYNRHLESAADFGPPSRYLLTQAFDSFFAVLPDGAEVAIEADGTDLQLPRLGLRIACPQERFRLRRGGNGILEIQTTAGVRSIDPASPPADLWLPRLAIHEHPSELLQVDAPSLFEESYRDQLVPDSPAVPKLAGMIAECLDLIGQAMPGLAARIESLIRWYVPIYTPGLMTHNSFSSPSLVGVIFLSEAYLDYRLAEAIVHEFHHNELYTLMEVDPLFEDVPGELLYSPWRPDPRPLYGLFHALHVFSGVVDFYRHLEEIPAMQALRAELRWRRGNICCQIRTGLQQVREEHLTAGGHDILESIRQELLEHEADLGPLPSELPGPQAEHLRIWLRENPRLASQVRGIAL